MEHFTPHNLTRHRTIKWVENLAEQESLVGSGDRTSVDITTTRDQVLNFETSAFVREIYRSFEYQVRLFNIKVKHAFLHVKITRTGEAPDSFSLLRNNVRLSLTQAQHGVIQFQCDKKMEYSDDPLGHPKHSLIFSGIVEARFGAFHEVEWLFLGSPVRAEQVACHYITEFLQVSR